MRLGLRLQLLLALGALLVVAFVPLYFAVASIAEASLASARRGAARDLGRAVAGHVLSSAERGDVSGLLEAQLSEGGVIAIAIYDSAGSRASEAGDTDTLPARVTAGREVSQVVETDAGPALLVIVPRAGRSCAITITLHAASGRAALVRLVGLYTGVVALALLVFAYLAMTRLVVRPVEALSNAAGRVASGGRSLEIPEVGAAELRRLAASLREMTERLLADEEALRGKVRELETTTHELASAQETLIRSERLASVGRLAAGMAHEIGNPLAALLGLEELLMTGDLPADERRDVLVRMKRETERIHRVLRDLLAFSRTRTAETAEQGRADIAAVLAEVLALLGPQKEMRDIEIESDVPNDICAVSIPPERLQQVLLNLLLNAADEVPRPGGKIGVVARHDDETVVIEVDDNGPGIAKSARDKLFEPFFTTKEVGKGTGLGLAVCRGVIEAAGGTIAAGESPSGGARFSIRLPRA
ncbi:MAG: HAMP domain-containing histidine kinase [Polyangiaceae bacterium]|nr:HAMP domain-containing histidine kinase [Polyangiaceae bacterium]